MNASSKKIIALSDDDVDRIVSALVARLGQAAELPCTDWVDQYRAGEALRTDEAATIADVSAETIRRHCADGERNGRPIGVLVAGSVWLVSRRRLLDEIERRDGRPERLAAESRAQKNAKMWPQPQSPIPFVAMATSGAVQSPDESA